MPDSARTETNPELLPLPPVGSCVPGVFWRPNEAFVEQLAGWLEGKRVLEVFAGNGYLAALLARAGVAVTATTRFSSHDAHSSGLYFPVLESEASRAVSGLGRDHDVLLMSWPTVTDAVLQAAYRWGFEKPIVFIGEVTDYAKGHLGGCATDEFFEAIDVTHRFQAYSGNMLEAAFVCRLRPNLALAR